MDKQQMKMNIRLQYRGKGSNKFLSKICSKMFGRPWGVLNSAQIRRLYDTLLPDHRSYSSKRRLELEAMPLPQIKKILKSLGQSQSQLKRSECIERLLMMEDDEDKTPYDIERTGYTDKEIIQRTTMKEFYEGKDRESINREKIMKKYNYKCRICNDSVKDGGGIVHHIKLKAFYGSDKPDNLMVLCDECHDYWHQAPKLKAKFHIMQGLLSSPSTPSKESPIMWIAAELLWDSNHGTFTEKEGLIYIVNEQLKSVIKLTNDNPECKVCKYFKEWCECKEGFTPCENPITEKWLL